MCSKDDNFSYQTITMKKNLTALMLLISLWVYAAPPALPKNIGNQTTEALIIFYKTDCPYCQNMTKVLEKETGFVSLLEENFSVQRVNIMTEEGRKLADQFNVHAVPSFIRFNTESGENSMIKGFPGIQKLAALLHLEYSVPVEEAVIQDREVTVHTVNETATASTGKILVGCGDGIVQGTEQCDDGNVVNGDGCSSTCTIQPGYTCVGTPSVCTTTCGDGVKAGAETCDDGNTVNGDGCSSTCSTELGFNCVGSPSTCVTVCGDGIKVGAETCDDGNVANGDGCSSTCSTEAGYNCAGSPSVCTPSTPPNDDCANAISFSGQTGTVPGDNTNATNPGTFVPACSTFEKDLWYKFTLGTSTPVQLALNGVSMTDPILALYSGSCAALTLVTCDDDSGPGLNSLITTTLAAGTYYVRVISYSGTGPHSGTFNLVYNISGNICGDGILAANEECDDGNLTDGDGCSSACKFENSNTIKGVAINRDGLRADPSSMLDVKSTDGGVLIPRMSSTQRAAITSPAKGLLVFDNTSNTFWYYKTGTGWTEINGAAGTGFGVTNSGSVAFNGSGVYTPAWPTELYDDGNNFASNIFTAPQAGVYQFTASYTVNSSAVPLLFLLIADIRSAGTIYTANTVIVPVGVTGAVTVTVTAMAKLSAGTGVYSDLSKSAASTSNITGSTFNGYRVY